MEKEAKEQDLGGICEASGIWETPESHLRGILEASGKHLGGIWETFGMHLGDIWEASGGSGLPGDPKGDLRDITWKS